MREGEILNLTWEKVLLKERLIKLRPEDTKDDEAREVPVSNELLEILNRLPRGIQGDYPVFTYKGKPIEEDIRTGLKKACDRAGILYGRFEDGGFVFHDLRRTFITDMRRAGVDQAVTMEITGHSRKETIDRYNQVTMDDMKQAVEKLALYRRAQLANVDQSVDQVAILGR
jgi:integrase